MRSMGVSTTDARVLDGHPQVHPLVSSMTYTEKAAPAAVVYKCWMGTRRERTQMTKRLGKKKCRLQQQLLVELLDCPCSQ